MRRGTHLVAALLCVASLGTADAAAGRVRLRDLNDQLVDPFQSPPNTRAIVFLFVGTDCPISNRYAPKVRQLFDALTSHDVVFWLVYPNPSDSLDAIRAHLAAFAYPDRALRDPQHALVKEAQVMVTPEAAVYDNHGQLAYRGRIDDRYVSLGVERPAPTHQDLEEAIAAVLAGKRVSAPVTQAVGCFIADGTER